MSRQASSTWLDHRRVNGTCSCSYLLGGSVSQIERGRFYQWDTTDDHKSFFFSPKSETSLESFSPCQVSSPNICTCVPVKSHIILQQYQVKSEVQVFAPLAKSSPVSLWGNTKSSLESFRTETIIPWHIQVKSFQGQSEVKCWIFVCATCNL